MSSTLQNPAPQRSPELMALVRGFDRDANAHRKSIRDFQHNQPEAFYVTAIDLFKQDADSRVMQYIISILLAEKQLFRALCDPALDRERALALARQAIRADPMADVSLARELADVSTAGPTGEMRMLERLIEMLDEISDGKRILPSLMRLLRIDNPYLRSKAVLMIGRGGRSLTWIKRRLEEPDTRVRANAVEALWGMESAEVREMLEIAGRDSNNRVAGNGLLGLYWMGECSVLPEIVKMASHASTQFRRTIAWAMGQTGDPRFSEILGRMLSDSRAEVRRTAFQSVRQIRTAVLQTTQSKEWRVSGYLTQRDARTGQRRLSVAVVSQDGREQPLVQPVQFHLSEHGQTCWSYKVIERPAPEGMTVTFLFPRTLEERGDLWDQGALECLQWKRSSDLWCAVPYLREERSTEGEGLELPSFIANSAQAEAAFQKPAQRSDCSGFWTAILRVAQAPPAPVRGKRHMIVLAPADVGDPPELNVLAAVQTARISIQVVTSTPNPSLQDFCDRAGGQFHLVHDPSVIPAQISSAYLNLLARHEIRYQPVVTEATEMKLRVLTPNGWGEAIIPLENGKTSS